MTATASGYRAAFEVVRKNAVQSIALTEKNQEKGGNAEFSYHAGYLAALRLRLINVQMVLNLEDGDAR